MGSFKVSFKLISIALMLTLFSGCASNVSDPDSGGGIGGTGNEDPCAQAAHRKVPTCRRGVGGKLSGVEKSFQTSEFTGEVTMDHCLESLLVTSALQHCLAMMPKASFKASLTRFEIG